MPDPWVAHEERFDPFGTDVAAEGGGQAVVQSAMDHEVPVAVDLADVTGAPRTVRPQFVEIAVHERRAVDDNFAVLDPDPEAR